MAQSRHLQRPGVQENPPAKQSQYFFTHLDFLQKQRGGGSEAGGQDKDKAGAPVEEEDADDESGEGASEVPRLIGSKLFGCLALAGPSATTPGGDEDNDEDDGSEEEAEVVAARAALSGWPKAGGRASRRTVPSAVTALAEMPSTAKIWVLGRNVRLLFTRHLATARRLRSVSRSWGRLWQSEHAHAPASHVAPAEKHSQ